MLKTTTTMNLPAFVRIKRDLPPETVVRIKTKENVTWEGIVHHNPIEDKTHKTHRIYLLNPLRLDTNWQRNQITPFEERDIESVEVIREVIKIPKVTRIIESVCETYEVMTLDDFHKALQGIKELKKIGITLLGRKYGRHLDVCYVVMFTKDALIVVNMKELESQMIRQECQDKPKKKKKNNQVLDKQYSQLWEAMDVSIFSNVGLLKVVYSGLAISDYLYHNHSIVMKNVADIQVGHIAIMKRKLKGSNIFGQQYNGVTRRKYMTLAQTLKYYLPKIVLREEIAILEKVDEEEEEEWFSSSPFSQMDPENIYKKYAALQVKYILQLYKVMFPPIFNVWSEFSSFVINLPMDMSMDKSRKYTTCPTEIPLDVQEYASKLNFDLK